MPNVKDIFREERLRLILEELTAIGKIHVTALARQFHVSQSSIRLDLAELEQHGLLKRTYGGAILPEPGLGQILLQKGLLEDRIGTLKAEKEAIAQTALTFVQNGDSLFLDGGSTLGYFGRELRHRDRLTLVTNATNILPDLYSQSSHTIYVVGGTAIPRYEILVGELALEGLSHFHAEKCFLGVDGISLSQGLTAADFSVAAVKRAMVASSKRLIVLCDHTKLDQISLAPVAPLEKIDTFITDEGASPAFLEALRLRGMQVIVARLT